MIDMHTVEEHLRTQIAELRAQLAEVLRREARSRESNELHKVNEARLAEAQRVARFGNWEWDVRTNTVYWSDELYRIFGAKPGEFIVTYEGFLERTHPDDREYIEDHIRATLERNVPYAIRFRILRPNGGIRYLQAEGQLKRGPDGAPIRLIGTCQDVTDNTIEENERRQLESQLNQARQWESLAGLAGGVAQDFNDLLTTIAGSADLALLELPKEAAARCRLETIKQSVAKAAKLTNYLMTYSGCEQYDLAPISLNDIVQGCTDELDRATSIKSAIHYRLAEELPAAMGEREQLKRIVMNLVSNASDAIGDRHGVVVVSTGVFHVDSTHLANAYLADELPEGQYVFLRITDNGVGMDEETRARIFDPFYTTKKGRHGLGLTAVSGIVRSHRGAVMVHSELDRGANVTVLLPVAAQAEAEASHAVAARSWRASGTVLVVDDEAPVRSVIKLLLERHGLRVLTARDAREAIDAFLNHRTEIAAVLLDYHLSRGTGAEVYTEIEALEPALPVIVLAGGADRDGLRERFIGARILPKPFQAAALVETLRGALESV